MFIPDALKVNKFVAVKLPENCTYFSRFGYQVPASQLYTGDDRAQMPQNKVDQICDYLDYAKMMAEQSSKSSSDEA